MPEEEPTRRAQRGAREAERWRRRRAEPFPGGASFERSEAEWVRKSFPGPAHLSRGVVEAIFVTPRAAAAVREVEQVRAVEGRGLEGDRYLEARGTWSRTPGAGRAITLIDADALDAVVVDLGIELRAGQHRRNVVTRGVALLELVGRRFWVGDALCEGVRECAPCGHMERLAAPGARAALEGRGGVRAEILRSGTIRRGDAIRIAD